MKRGKKDGEWRRGDGRKSPHKRTKVMCRDRDDRKVGRRDNLIKSHSFEKCSLEQQKCLVLHHRSHRLFFMI